ncbi:MAG: ArnT family glycosyltransferase [Candidatus Binatia bacterium]
MQSPRASLLVAITVLAAALRFWGLFWAAPDRIDLHPDEVDHVMSHALSISLADPDPKFLNYPSLLMYTIAAANGVLRRLRLIDADWQSYVVGRSIVAGFGAATAPVAFWLAEAVGASLAGAALAGLWMALLPVHVWESHVAVTDVVMTFWVMVALLLSVRLIRRESNLDYALAGGAIGLAVASKYTAALVAIAPVVALARAHRPIGRRLRGLAVVGVSAAAACVLATPYSFYHFDELRRAMAYEWSHTHGFHTGFSLPAIGPQYRKYLYQIVAAWPFRTRSSFPSSSGRPHGSNQRARRAGAPHGFSHGDRPGGTAFAGRFVSRARGLPVSAARRSNFT